MTTKNRSRSRRQQKKAQDAYQSNNSVSTDTEQTSLPISEKIFYIVMLFLSATIVWTGLKIATQIQHYRNDYKELQYLKQNYRKLQVEHQRLLIEQQTFSATPQIASRAVSELNMHFPSFREKMIVQPKAVDKNKQVAISKVKKDGEGSGGNQ